MAGEELHELNNVRIGGPPILTMFVFLRTQTRVIAAVPMDDELDLVSHYVNYNLVN
jgi:hypothetical protein